MNINEKKVLSLILNGKTKFDKRSREPLIYLKDNELIDLESNSEGYVAVPNTYTLDVLMLFIDAIEKGYVVIRTELPDKKSSKMTIEIKKDFQIVFDFDELKKIKHNTGFYFIPGVRDMKHPTIKIEKNGTIIITEREYHHVD